MDNSSTSSPRYRMNGDDERQAEREARAGFWPGFVGPEDLHCIEEFWADPWEDS